jgi:hypothetical protein
VVCACVGQSMTVCAQLSAKQQLGDEYDDAYDTDVRADPRDSDMSGCVYMSSACVSRACRVRVCVCVCV